MSLDIMNLTSTSPPLHTTTAAPNTGSQLYLGFIGCAVAALFFGSNYVPVKKFKTGDGMFFQWILCIAIWSTGLVVYLIEGSPKFYPLAMLGGALWATGNVCVVPIFKTIGMTIGLLCWSAFNLLAGWASGRFGLFGLKAEVPNEPTLNYIGVACALISVVIYVFINTDVTDHTNTSTTATTRQQRLDTMTNDTSHLVNSDVITEDRTPLYGGVSSDSDREMPSQTHADGSGSVNHPGDDPGRFQRGDDATPPRQVTDDGDQDSDVTFLDLLSPRNKKILGLTLAVISGLFYGVTFAPVIYIKDNYTGASDKDLEYVFSHFTGILLTSTSLFTIYAAYMQNRPKVYPQIILPALVSGVMWAIAQCGWFVANQYLSEAISFPIITTLPGIVASLWGVLVFKEIRGRRNLGLLGLAFLFVITGSVLSGLSKI